MPKACIVCAKTTDLRKCTKCKSVYYCSREHQAQDWREHKTLCKRTEFAGAPCDVCQDSEQDIIDTCYECGFIFCNVCHDKMVVHDHMGEEIGFGSCPGCDTPRHFVFRQHGLVEFQKKLEKIIKERKGNPREARWLVQLGNIFKEDGMDEKAKDCYLSAGELGLGEAYNRIAEMYAAQGEWDEVRQYFRKAADRMHVPSIYMLGTDALQGFLRYPDGRYSPRHPPDLKEAFRLFREGASLGDVDCCTRLGHCYLRGDGTKMNLEKAFKWFQKAVEKGDVEAFYYFGEFYHHGYVVEQSHVQAKYWFKKVLDSDQEGAEELKKAARERIRMYNL